MQRRLVVSAMATVLAFPLTSSLHAAPMNFLHRADSAAKVSTKTIGFNVRNDGSATLVLQAGDQQMTIEPGKSTSVKLAAGVKVINVSGSSKSPAGSVVTVVSEQLKGNTLAIS